MICIYQVTTLQSVGGTLQVYGFMSAMHSNGYPFDCLHCSPTQNHHGAFGRGRQFLAVASEQVFNDLFSMVCLLVSSIVSKDTSVFDVFFSNDPF